MLGQVVDVPADPVLLARRLEASGANDVALMGDGHGIFYVAADHDAEVCRLDPFEGGLDAPPDLARAPRFFGMIPYDARRSLERAAWSPRDERPRSVVEAPMWRRFPAVLRVDRGRGEVMAIGMERSSVASIASRARFDAARPRKVEVETRDDEPLSAHADRVRAAKELIAAGDLYQVNLARRIRVRCREEDALSLFERLNLAAPSPLASFFRMKDGVTIASSSPELLLDATVDPRTISRRFTSLRTAPIKGTRPRGADATSDADLARALDEDPKERAELAMILDVVRSDLGRVAEIGSVRMIAPPHVVTHRTIHHRLAVLAARARPDASREDVLLATVPSGSVTGAPKVRAMEVIRALEPRRRGLYTGAIGFVAHDGSATLAMAIRTLVARGDEGEYWTGGGIVEGSDPDREVEETRWKALQLAAAAAG